MPSGMEEAIDKGSKSVPAPAPLPKPAAQDISVYQKTEKEMESPWVYRLGLENMVLGKREDETYIRRDLYGIVGIGYRLSPITLFTELNINGPSQQGEVSISAMFFDAVGLRVASNPLAPHLETTDLYGFLNYPMSDSNHHRVGLEFGFGCNLAGDPRMIFPGVTFDIDL